MIINSIYFIDDQFNMGVATSQNVRFAFLLQLPFRVRIGAFYKHRFVFRGRDFEIALRNKIALSGEKTLEEILKTLQSPDDFWTDMLVVILDPRVDDPSLEKLRNWVPDSETPLPLDPSCSMQDAVVALNHFIMAYDRAADTSLGEGLQAFRVIDFIQHLIRKITIFCSSEKEMLEDEYMGIFESNDCRSREAPRVIGVSGELYDFPAEELSEAIERNMIYQDRFIHYELAFEAKTKMLSNDVVGALLMAMAALEGAHAAFVQYELEPKLPPSKDKHLPSEFLRSLGINLCNRLTPYLMMEEAERPSPEIIDRCEFGIKLRNEIMHAKRNKRKEYLLRIRTANEIEKGYSAILQVYRHYVSALERRIRDRE